ncbi:hypothetical protein PHSY_005490 [Pseudozyma hubeiensis SY62]|uniref:Uncharacterized protein n=1 Tax=Pseudozyma hubeiensis (strain SY62) TaxID=1305764 RepID=R9P9J2_PSEHS|nr:hypothetical protein PHSY_005490 [Pseudozyma hubeiensis SY62]GAC97902.1 hypothetical protein PHSY_005490 [Pseudozyma hubeiensis SY62]
MASAFNPVDDAKPLLLILDDDGSHIDEWLASHPPSRLGAPVALNNGTNPRPIWVLKVPSLDQLAELAPTNDSIFTKADELVRTATAQVTEIQNDNNIPVHAGKIKSKKQCRTEVQDAFHDEIMLMTADHPLWGQGKWTMLIRPSEVDRVFTQLAKSLASGDLKYSSIIALRARVLPSDEGATDSNKRPKTSQGRRTSNRSPTSSRQPQVLLGIDIFFRPVWDSNAAREVLRVVAGASGRMASFCKSSLYSRLGVKKDHLLGAHASLYNSKTLVSPADAKLWVAAYSADGNAASDRSHLADDSPFEDASSTAVAANEAESFIEGEGVPSCAIKRPLEESAVLHAGDRAEKKARSIGNDDDDGSKQQPTPAPVSAASLPAEEAQSKESQQETGESESQYELMLPVRAASNPSTDRVSKSLSIVSEEISKKTSETVPDAGIAYEHQGKLVKPVVDTSQGKVVPCVGKETQTQEETFGADHRGAITEETRDSKNNDHEADESRENNIDTSQEDPDAEGESIEEEHGSQETPQRTDGEQQPAVRAQEALAAEEQIALQEQPLEAPGVDPEPEQAAVSTGHGEEADKDQPLVTAAVPAEAASPPNNVPNNVATVPGADGRDKAQIETSESFSCCQQTSSAVHTMKKPDAAAKSHLDTLGDIQTEPGSSKAMPHGTGADDAAPAQDASDAHARQVEARVAVTLDTLSEPKTVIEASIEAPAQAAPERADHAQQADDNNRPVPTGNNGNEIKVAEIAASDPMTEPKPNESKASAADHNGTNAVKADGQTISAHADEVEMTMDELIVEGATAEPSVPGQGGLEADAK